ncbi:MAG: type II toxin-antitoxin system death-on-curing family toxin [Planctomycetota bacterium]
MDEPTWINPAAVTVIHSSQLAEHGGQDGVRDVGLLESALDRPKNQWAYSSADLPQLAAAHAYGIARNHPFVDGNKRTAAVVFETFLIINGAKLDATNDDLYTAVYSLAAGDWSEEQFAGWPREHVAGSA